MEKLPLVILAGPTAVGKTALSLSLAKAVGGEIISCDSMQVYKYMNIGSAKISPEKMQGIPHYLIDVLDPKESFSVAHFTAMAKDAMKQIYANGHIPIAVGGTGFYLQALLYDTDFQEETADLSYRSTLEEYAKKYGNEALYQRLLAVDPGSRGKIHPNNRKRVIRALEYYHLHQAPISAHNSAQRARESPYRFCYFVLNENRQKLYQKIDLRVDQMMEQGLFDEVKKLYEMGYDRSLVSMQGLGYKELFAVIEGEDSLEHAVYTIKRDTRHFAKRQLTWFRSRPEVIWVNRKDDTKPGELLDFLIQKLDEQNITKRGS